MSTNVAFFALDLSVFCSKYTDYRLVTEYFTFFFAWWVRAGLGSFVERSASETVGTLSEKLPRCPFNHGAGHEKTAPRAECPGAVWESDVKI